MLRDKEILLFRSQMPVIRKGRRELFCVLSRKERGRKASR